MRRIAIVGSRDIPPGLETEIEAQIEDLLDCERMGEISVISGGARGVDSIARRAAEHLWIRVHEFLPDWETHGKRAGFLRNRQIVENCDEVHAWWDGKSRGTAHTIKLARKAGKPVTIHALDAGSDPAPDS